MNNSYLIYAPLIIAIYLIGFSADMYYNHRYEIKDSNSINKYKLSQQNILIKLKLFKYDNNFNYFLLVPYLIAWNLFFVILILYIIYWCGAVKLAVFFTNKWVVFPLMILILLYMGYEAIIQQLILNNGFD